MRETQFVGLTQAAETFIDNFATKVLQDHCRSCGQILPVEKQYEYPMSQEGEEVLGMFEESVHKCRIFTHKVTSQRFEEYVFAEPWSSGPMIFLALRWVDTKEMIKESTWKIDETIYSEFDYLTGKMNF
jgi:hypothetical protein